MFSILNWQFPTAHGTTFTYQGRLADSVALAAIQGLNKKLQQPETEMAELRQTVNEPKELVQNPNRKLHGGAR